VTPPAPHPFSPEGRLRALEEMGRTPLDVLVVGGGITGAGVARDAALRGWRVGLVEKEDFAFGTSSRSSKIIHGGVRYLEYGQFLLVRESARERKALLGIAPHLVHPLPFIYPIFGGDRGWLIRAGMAVFDLLAGASRAERHRNLTADEVRERLPGLRDPLKGGVSYLEYITDDARFTLENALSAALHGALVVNHARAVELLARGGRVVGARVRDTLGGGEHEVRARVVVNAAGPWVQTVLEEASLPVRKKLVPSKGIHILLPAERLPIEGACFLTSSGGRRGLAMRRQGFVYVGTSDVEYRLALDTPRATRPEVEELLAMVRDCFPGLGLVMDDVIVTWAGVRPLIRQEGRSTRDTSREDEVWPGPEGLVTIAGGKLTTYRRMAARAVRALSRPLGPPPRKEDRTAHVPLPGAEGIGDPIAFRKASERALAERGVGEDAARRLAWLYGAQLRDLLRWGDEDRAWLEPLHPRVPALRGEVRHAVEREMASTLVDFMDRRSALLLFSSDQGLPAAGAAADLMGDLLGWDRERRELEVERYREYALSHRVPEPRSSEAR